MVSTFSGGILSTSLASSGILLNGSTRAMGTMSSRPIAAPRKVAAPRSSSVASAARARSLASPEPAAPAANAPRPRAPAVPKGVNAAAAGTAARPAIEPSAELSL